MPHCFRECRRIPPEFVLNICFYKAVGDKRVLRAGGDTQPAAGAKGVGNGGNRRKKLRFGAIDERRRNKEKAAVFFHEAQTVHSVIGKPVFVEKLFYVGAAVAFGVKSLSFQALKQMQIFKIYFVGRNIIAVYLRQSGNSE